MADVVLLTPGGAPEHVPEEMVDRRIAEGYVWPINEDGSIPRISVYIPRSGGGYEVGSVEPSDFRDVISARGGYLTAERRQEVDAINQRVENQRLGRAIVEGPAGIGAVTQLLPGGLGLQNPGRAFGALDTLAFGGISELLRQTMGEQEATDLIAGMESSGLGVDLGRLEGMMAPLALPGPGTARAVAEAGQMSRGANALRNIMQFSGPSGAGIAARTGVQRILGITPELAGQTALQRVALGAVENGVATGAMSFTNAIQQNAEISADVLLSDGMLGAAFGTGGEMLSLGLGRLARSNALQGIFQGPNTAGRPGVATLSGQQRLVFEAAERVSRGNEALRDALFTGTTTPAYQMIRDASGNLVRVPTTEAERWGGRTLAGQIIHRLPKLSGADPAELSMIGRMGPERIMGNIRTLADDLSSSMARNLRRLREISDQLAADITPGANEPRRLGVMLQRSRGVDLPRIMNESQALLDRTHNVATEWLPSLPDTAARSIGNAMKVLRQDTVANAAAFAALPPRRSIAPIALKQHQAITRFRDSIGTISGLSREQVSNLSSIFMHDAQRILEDEALWGFAGAREALRREVLGIKGLTVGKGRYAELEEQIQSRFGFPSDRTISEGVIKEKIFGGRGNYTLISDMMEIMDTYAAHIDDHVQRGRNAFRESKRLGNLTGRLVDEIGGDTQVGRTVAEVLTTMKRVIIDRNQASGLALPSVLGMGAGFLLGSPGIGIGAGIVASVIAAPGPFILLSARARQAFSGFAPRFAQKMATLRGSLTSDTPAALARGLGRSHSVNILLGDDEEEAAAEYTHIVERLSEVTPEAMVDIAALNYSDMGALGGHALQDALTQRTLAALEHLRQVAPMPVLDYTTGQFMPPPRTHIDALGEALTVIEDPLSVLDRAANRSLSPEAARTFRVVYPELHLATTEMLNEAILEMSQNGERPTYSAQLSLGVLFDVPFENTLSPDFIRSMQQSYAQTVEQAAAISGPASRRSTQTRLARHTRTGSDSAEMLLRSSY